MVGSYKWVHLVAGSGGCWDWHWSHPLHCCAAPSSASRAPPALPAPHTPVLLACSAETAPASPPTTPRTRSMAGCCWRRQRQGCRWWPWPWGWTPRPGRCGWWALCLLTCGTATRLPTALDRHLGLPIHSHIAPWYSFVSSMHSLSICGQAGIVCSDSRCAMSLHSVPCKQVPWGSHGLKLQRIACMQPQIHNVQLAFLLAHPWQSTIGRPRGAAGQAHTSPAGSADLRCNQPINPHLRGLERTWSTAPPAGPCSAGAAG